MHDKVEIYFAWTTVFTAIVLLILTAILLLTFCDWVRTFRFSSKISQKQLKSISQAILLSDWERAEKELAPFISGGRLGKEATLYYLQVLRGTNRLQQADALVKEASRLYPEDLLFRLEEGKILLQLKKPKEALESFQVCSPILRGEQDHLTLAGAFLQMEMPNQCLEVLNPWLEETQSGEMIALAADALFALKRFKEAIEFYNHAIKLGYQTHHVCAQLGSAFRRLGNLGEAERTFRNLLEKNPTDLMATLGLGGCMQERGHHQKALLFYQSSGAWGLKDPQLMKEAGICALRSQKFMFAEHYFLEALSSSKSDPYTLIYYGYSLEGQKKWQEAEQVYLKLIQLFPAFPYGFRALAWLFGVGLSTTLTNEQGLHFAHAALKLKNDIISWEILSAVEARTGNFTRAYQIQEQLSTHDQDRDSRLRRQQVLRKLRNNDPLDDLHVLRALVA